MRFALLRRLAAFRPPLFRSAAGALVFSGLSLWTVAMPETPRFVPAIRYAVYGLAMLFLVLAAWAMARFFRAGTSGRQAAALAGRYPFVGRLQQDVRLRAFSMGLLSLPVNGALALSKIAAGWRCSSAWLAALGGYYLVLCITRTMLLCQSRAAAALPDPRDRLRREWQAYRLCGWMLVVLSVALQGVALQIVQQGQGFVYGGYGIYAVALYDFYCLTAALLFLIRSRKRHTPVVRALRYVSLAVSLVSMLSLQTAMFAAFGQDMPPAVRRQMNLVTGTAVCLLLAVLGLGMAMAARRALRTPETEKLCN